MADTVNKSFFDALLDAKAAKWSAGVAFDRSNPLPLDQWSVFKDLAAAEAYLTNAKAYPGQIIAYAEADVFEEDGTTLKKAGGMVACVLSSNAEGTGLELKQIGISPDRKTLEVNAEGAMALYGASGAANGTLPMIGDDGKLTWKTLEDIGAGDGNDNTTYEFSFANEKITITPKFNGQPIMEGEGEEVTQVIYELDLSSFVTSTELEGVIGKAAEGETAATGLYKIIADALQEAKTYADENDDNDNTTYTIGYEEKVEGDEGHPARIVLTPSTGEATYIDATPFIRDGMLHNVDYDADKKELVFQWNTDAGIQEDRVPVDSLVDTYTAGNGLDLANNAFSVKLAEGNESFLTVDANGVKLSGVQEAINAAEGRAASDATTKANTAKSEAIADAAEKYATKEYVGTIPNDSEGNPEAANVIAYVNKKAQEVLDSATGGSSESAASVKQQLDTYKSENDPKVKALLTEVWGSETYTGDSRIDALENVGAQANVLENVVGAENNKLSISGIVDKTITIDDSAIQALITAAQNKANDAASAASNAQSTADANAQNIQTNTSDIGNLKTLTEGHTTKISALETADSTHAAEFAALSGTVQTHGTDIASLKTGKADTTVTDALAGRVTANENALKSLNDTTIPNINTEIGKKANSVDVYTKGQVDDITGTPTEGKTIVQMIEDLANAAYDDTEVRGLIADIYTPAKGETPASGALIDLVKAEENRAKGIEADHEERIAEMENFWKAADDPEGTIDKLAEIVSYIEADKSGALDMAADIQTNTEAIAAINHAETGILALANAHSDENLTTAIGYVDDAVLGLQASIHGVDDKTIKLNENKAYVAEVSTDILMQGTRELVLFAGNAAGFDENA